MANRPPILSANKYRDASFMFKVFSETRVESLTTKSGEAFRVAVQKKYAPLYREAGQIPSPVKRRRALRKLDTRMSTDIKSFYQDFKRVTLNPLAEAQTRLSRIKYQFLQGVSLRKKRAPLGEVKKTADTETLQLRKTTKVVDKRHRGPRDHVVSKLAAGMRREANKMARGVIDQSTFENRTRGWFDTVARTEAQGTISRADKEAISEVFDKYIYVAILDVATTEICSTLDGQIFDATKGDSTKPPQHFNCRSEIQPVPEDPKKAAELREATKTKFNTWLKKQSESVQNSIIPKSQLKAWKAGRYQPKPQFKLPQTFLVDKNSGLPIVDVKANRDQIARIVSEVDITYRP